MKRVCSKCKIEKELNADNFGKRRRDKFGFDTTCKECRKEYDKKRYKENGERLKSEAKARYWRNRDKRQKYQKNYYEQNKEECIERQKKWDKDNPIQRRIINNLSRCKEFGKCTLTEQEWIETLNYFDNRCAYCGMTIDDHKQIYGEVLNQDHLIPINKGGEYKFKNIIPSCRSCNSKKKDNDFSEWYKNSDVYNFIREAKIKKFIQGKELVK